jgi:hypothetical protein
MAYAHIFEIPDQGGMKGGDLFDRYGNLEYFAAVDALTDKTKTAADINPSVKAHSRSPYMNAKGKISVSAHERFLSTGIRQTKGAIPGVTVTLQGGSEKRQFQWTGTMSALYAWLKTTAQVDVIMFGPTGTPYDEIVAVSQGSTMRAAG